VIRRLLELVPDQEVESHLLDDEGEDVVDLVRHHGIVFAQPIVELIGTLLLWLLSVTGPIELGWLFILAGIALALHAVYLTLRERRDVFVITNMRVFRASGVFSVRIATMPITRILDITRPEATSGPSAGLRSLHVRVRGSGAGSATDQVHRRPRCAGPDHSAGSATLGSARTHRAATSHGRQLTNWCRPRPRPSYNEGMNFSRPGAIDLSALKQPPERPAQAPMGDAGSYVVDITEHSFQHDALEASMNHIVILSLWSPRSPQSMSFNASLAAIVSTYGGQIVLAQVDIDANPAIAQALGAQAVPLVVGLIKGQPVPLFQGTVDEAEVRRYFDELVTVAVQNGVTGRAPGGPAAGVPETEQELADDPRFAAADAAFAAGDFDAAVAEYDELLAQHPADAEIAERLAGVRLLSRTQDVDLQSARQAASDAPDDVAAQLLVADLDVSGGHVEDAFDRLIGLVRCTSGDERDAVRERMLELFTVVGVGDPRVASARRALAAALF